MFQANRSWERESLARRGFRASAPDCEARSAMMGAMPFLARGHRPALTSEQPRGAPLPIRRASRARTRIIP
ncbi:MAG: hypothetical protein C4346_05145, partial [Chloroflexota bacterium]